MIHSIHGFPTERRGLHLVSTTKNPLKSQHIRILAKLRFISLGNREKPTVAMAKEVLMHELNQYLDSNLGEFNCFGPVHVTEIQDIDSSANMNTCPVHAFTYLNTQQVNERTNLRDVMDEAYASLEMISLLLETKPEWRLFYKKPHIAPLQGEGFSPWLHNAIVTADVNSTLML